MRPPSIALDPYPSPLPPPSPPPLESLHFIPIRSTPPHLTECSTSVLHVSFKDVSFLLSFPLDPDSTHSLSPSHRIPEHDHEVHAPWKRSSPVFQYSSPILSYLPMCIHERYATIRYDMTYDTFTSSQLWCIPHLTSPHITIHVTIHLTTHCISPYLSQNLRPK